MTKRRLLPAGLLLLVGCGGDAGVVPVSGRVLVGGKPVVGAVVQFQPAADGPAVTHAPNAVTDGDGRFRLSYAGVGDGAPPGRYAVSVALYAADGEGQRVGRNLLPERYADSAKSGLTADVGPGPTDLPAFDLPPR